MLDLPPLLEWIPMVSPELGADTGHLRGVGEVFERARLGEAVRVVCTVPIRHFLPFSLSASAQPAQERRSLGGWGAGPTAGDEAPDGLGA